MSLHFQYLGEGLSSQKTMELLQKHCQERYIIHYFSDQEKIEEFGTTFDELLEQENYGQLAKSTLSIIELSNDKTLLQPIYSSIQYWITKLNAKEQQKMIDLFLNHVEQINDGEAAFKTKMQIQQQFSVAQLFNTLNASTQSLNLFLKLLQLSKKWNTVQLILPPIISNIKEFLNQWTLNSTETLNVLNAIAESVDASEQQTKQFSSQQVISISEYILRNITVPQEQYIKTFVKFQNHNTSFLKLCEITQTSQFQVIEKTQVNSLIKLVLAGDLAGTQSLLVKEEAYFKSINFNAEQYLNQTRIAKFIQLSSQKQSYTYQEIADALNLQAEKVETWVIHAIQSQNVSAQIDQSQQKIYVLDNSKKLLVKEDWQNLHSKLTTLLNKLKSVQLQ